MTAVRGLGTPAGRLATFAINHGERSFDHAWGLHESIDDALDLAHDLSYFFKSCHLNLIYIILSTDATITIPSTDPAIRRRNPAVEGGCPAIGIARYSPSPSAGTRQRKSRHS